jgi:Ca2+/H+ antiporter, TMEM165/GDT1 family
MNGLVFVSAFLAAAVEWVEALTIVLAVGLYRGWRSAVAGIVAAVVTLAALASAVSGLIGNHSALSTFRTLVGAALLLFGVRWLHKAILRAAGLKATHDEAAAFESTGRRLQHTPGAVGHGATAGGRGSGTGAPGSGAGGRGSGAGGWGAGRGVDRVGFLTAFGGVLLEGLEVIFIVVALGNLHGIISPVVGAGAALVAVAGMGVALRRPLTRVPENAMKFVVGVMLTAFGTFFAGEGLHVRWWHGDVSILILVGLYAVFALAAVAALRRRPGRRAVPRAFGWATATVHELWSLFVDNGPLALLVVVALLAVAYAAKSGGHGHPSGFWLAGAVMAALALTLVPAWRSRPAPPQPQPQPQPAPSPSTATGTPPASVREPTGA